MINLVAIANDGVRKTVIQRSTSHLKEIVEHEMWHAVDLAGNHSMKIGKINGSVKHYRDVAEIINHDRMADLALSNAHGAVSVQDLHKAVLEMSIERHRPYLQHPAERFVHDCMSENNGLEINSVEALSLSHSLDSVYLANLITLYDEYGFKITQIQGAMKRFISMFTQQERLRNILKNTHTAEYWEGL